MKGWKVMTLLGLVFVLGILAGVAGTGLVSKPHSSLSDP
jgi:hypothetical protein